MGNGCDREIDQWRKTNCRGKKRGLKMGTLITALVLLVIVIWVLASCIKIVPQAQAYVVERLGAYQGTWSVGLHFKTPFIDKIAKKVVLKEQVVDFAPQPVITKDNVTMRIDTVVFLSDHRSEAVCIRCGKSDHGNREPDSNNTSKYHR